MLKLGKFGYCSVSVMMFLKLPILAFLGKFEKTTIPVMDTEHLLLRSICPKNWKLPSSGDNTTKGTFGYLLTQYGVASSLSGTSSVNSNTYNIVLSPLFFVRGGNINTNVQQLRYAGQEGYFWSSRAFSSTDGVYYLIFGSGNSSVNPSRSDFSRSSGYSLRCLIPTT